MSAKYHIKDDGMPGTCSAASSESCPKTKAGDGFHGTLEEASVESQSRFEATYGESATASKSVKKDYSGLGGRELQKLAKDTDDADLQMEIATRGSDSARKNLARNPHATTEALDAAYTLTANSAVRTELAVHLNADLKNAEVAHVVAAMEAHTDGANGAKPGMARADRIAHREKFESIVQSDWIGDEALSGYAEKMAPENSGYRHRAKQSINPALANLNNNVTEDFAIALANETNTYGKTVIETGRVTPERIGELPAKAIRLNGDASEAHLVSAAKHISEGGWQDESATYRYFHTNSIGKEITENERAPREALEPLVGHPAVDQVSLYKAKNLSPESKAKLAASSPEVQSHLRVQEAVGGGRSMEELRQELIVKGGATDTQRGWHTAKFELDKDKIASYNLQKDDVEAIMGSGGVYQYNPESGVYGGSYDSGD